MTFQPGAMLYTQGFGSRPENVEVPHYDVRAPTAQDVNYPIGKSWLFVGNSVWILLSLSSVGGTISANWIELSTSAGSVLSVTGTANQITAVTTAGAVTLSIPATFIAPGSIASTTTLTGGTGITATTGNIVASAGNISASGTVTGGTGVIATTGNLTASAVGSGLVLTPTIVAAGASPQTANGRAFSVTFSGVSIPSGASQTFVISNTAITGTSTVALVEWSGATAGSALSISSQASTAGTLTFIMTNGTSATMVTSVANITFTGIVLN